MPRQYVACDLSCSSNIRSFHFDAENSCLILRNQYFLYYIKRLHKFGIVYDLKKRKELISIQKIANQVG